MLPGKRCRNFFARSNQPSGGSSASPPMRKYEVIMRWPETASNSRKTSSRSRKQYRNTVIAPMSMACVPSHTRCELMRVNLVQQHANPLRARRNLHPQQLLHRQAVGQVVGHGAEIVDAVGHGHDLLIELRFAGLLDAGVQIADVGHDAHDGFAVDFQQQPQHAVRRGMLRAHVQDHRLVLRRVQYRRWSHVRHQR